MAKTLRNGLIMIETNPINLNGWILQFIWGWHCTSLKKTAVKNAKKCMWHYKNQALYHNKNHIVISLDTIQAIYFCTFRLQKSIIHQIRAITILFRKKWPMYLNIWVPYFNLKQNMQQEKLTSLKEKKSCPCQKHIVTPASAVTQWGQCFYKFVFGLINKD